MVAGTDLDSHCRLRHATPGFDQRGGRTVASAFHNARNRFCYGLLASDSDGQW